RTGSIKSKVTELFTKLNTLCYLMPFLHKRREIIKFVVFIMFKHKSLTYCCVLIMPCKTTLPGETMLLNLGFRILNERVSKNKFSFFKMLLDPPHQNIKNHTSLVLFRYLCFIKEKHFNVQAQFFRK